MSSSAITGPVFSDNKRAPAGTAAAPSFAFNASTGTGVYLVSADVLGLSTAGVQRVVVDASGNVGINSTPSAWSNSKALQIAAGSTSTSVFSYNSGLGGMGNNFYAIPGTAEYYISAAAATRYWQYNGIHTWERAASGSAGGVITWSEGMRLDASGRLLVGYTSIGPWPTGSIGTVGFIGKAGSTGVLNTAGNVFNINWTGSAAQLWIDNINNGTISLTSDYRIKKNIETQEQPALERIAKLRPVRYELTDYKELFKADGVQREGFIAHELQEVIPSAVEGEKDAENQIQSLKLDALCSVLVKAIQEQQEIIGKQASAIEKLEARLAALEAK